MKKAFPIPALNRFTNRNPSWQVLENLLNLFSFPTLLYDCQRKKFLIANTAAIEQTAFTRAELTQLKLVDFLPGVAENELLSLREPSNNYRTGYYPARNGQKIAAQIQLQQLDLEGELILISFQALSVIDRQNAEEDRKANQLTNILALMNAIGEDDEDRAIDKCLDVGIRLTGADVLALYLVQMGNPELKRAFISGKDDVFPEKVEPPDMVNLYKNPIWTPGKRPICELQRVAHTSKLSYLAIYLLGEGAASIGLLAIGAHQGVPPDDLPFLGKMLTSSLTTLIQNKSLRNYLLENETRLKRKLRAAETFIEGTQEGCLFVSPDFVIEDINPAAESMLGYTIHEVSGRPLIDVIIGPTNINSALQAALLGISTPNLGEVRLLRRDGSTFLAHVSIHPLLTESGLEGLTVLFRDLSEHEEFQLRNQQLEHRAVLGEITAIFAHEVRNPINNISTGLQVMRMNLPPDDPNQEVINRLLTDCGRLTHLMSSILTFSKPSNKEGLVNLQELIQSVLDRWRPRMARLNIAHELNSHHPAPVVVGDARALEQVFNNLISNALEAMRETGGRLSINLRSLPTENGKETLEVNVIDNGPGIPEDIIDRIFEPFITTNRNGTGLGLSIAKRIVNEHKGLINALSVPGGTVFRVTFPLATDPAEGI